MAMTKEEADKIMKQTDELEGIIKAHLSEIRHSIANAVEDTEASKKEAEAQDTN